MRATVAANLWLSLPEGPEEPDCHSTERRSIQERGQHGGIATVFAACRTTGARMGYPCSPSLLQFMVPGGVRGPFPAHSPARHGSDLHWVSTVGTVGSLVLLVSSRARLVHLGWTAGLV